MPRAERARNPCSAKSVLLPGALLLASCQAAGLREAGGVDTLAPPPPPIAGSVERPFLYRILRAEVGTDVAPAASVSLIEPGTMPRTVATTVTTDSGQFVLAFGGGWSPAAGTVYYLEAFKGLNSNQAGADAVRLRTLVAWQGGWRSLTSGGVTLTRSTTAIAAAAQINIRLGSAVNLSSLLGKLAIGQSDGPTPDTFTAVTNLSVADYQGAWTAVDSALGGNLDPIATIDKANGAFYFKGTAGDTGQLGIRPGTGADVGDEVTIEVPSSNPLVFAADLSQNQVSIGGATAPVTQVASDGKWLKARVPDGATRGPVYAVGPFDGRGGVVDYPIWGTVRLKLQAIPQGSSAAKATLTLPDSTSKTETVSSPGATAELVFKGLQPGAGYTILGEALNSGNQWASETRIEGATDSVTLSPRPVAGPYVVNWGLNRWVMDLAISPLTLSATGSF